MDTRSENRKYIRVKISRSIKHVKFHLGGHSPSVLNALSKNLSAGGILFESEIKYDLGDIVRLEIDLPGWEKYKPEFYRPHLSKSDPVITLVKVTRIKPLGGGLYEIGASFVGIDDGHQMALAKFIKLQKQS